MAITSLPLGTVIRMSNDALSRGWSLAGNHQVAMCGSFMVTTSESLASQLLSPPDDSLAGTPAYRTETRNCWPLAIGCGRPDPELVVTGLLERWRACRRR